MKRQVFYSFHYANDAMRVQQIRNMGVIEGNTPASPNNWETIKITGDRAIEKWIDENMKYRSCVIVLVGEETANRKWVKYEIQKAWQEKKGLFGIYIHNLRDPRTGTCRKGKNPFDNFTFNDRPFSEIVPCYDPHSWDAYNDIKNHLDQWIENAIAIRNRY